MSPKRIFTLLILAGLVLDIVGLFLPWVEWRDVEAWGTSIGDYLGISIATGFGVVWGWFLAAIFGVLFMIFTRNNKNLLWFIIVGGIVTTIFSLSTIGNPTNSLGFVASPQYYTTAYGVYVSLAGGALILIGATCHAYISGLFGRLRNWIRNML